MRKNPFGKHDFLLIASGQAFNNLIDRGTLDIDFLYLLFSHTDIPVVVNQSVFADFIQRGNRYVRFNAANRIEPAYLSIFRNIGNSGLDRILDGIQLYLFPLKTDCSVVFVP
jgi:hypothetical protein